MMEKRCDRCRFRECYDKRPASWLGRLWRWHVGWCPGWRKFMRSLADEERIRLAEKYGLDKFT